ncbi:hypothetical protein AJ78_01900 [Emergomyces pasteurianus Ep9510]|uniref:Uncharacterized protein n=1 Tax=Emergomyces pasteurianus Ep9510 TaxID=1447872 RepID=A0A1J9PPI5_9EURO|nr:hypothetical protein AJ78_01900 [Emergomyces pasteurianus Ep9510]
MFVCYRPPVLLLSLAAVTFCSASSIWLDGENPGILPECEECIPQADILAPGIGFDITDSYGTAAVRYHNGSVANLARVDGDKDFQALMKKLAAGPPALDCSGSLSKWQEFLCWKSRLQRRLNKSRGLPATPDVGTLAKLFENLRLAVDNKLGEGACTRALFTLFPKLPGLAYEDFLDAVEYAGLDRIESPYSQDHISEVSAASGAMGFGICRNYTDVYRCFDEEFNMPYEQILFLSFTNASFTAINTYLSYAFYPNPTSSQLRWDLGRASFPENDQEAQRIYWRHIRDTIVKAGLEGIELPSALLIVGDHAADPMFQKTLNEALQDIFPKQKDVDRLRQSSEKGPQDVVEASSLDFSFLGARGAALFAKRSLEAPKFCWEPPECNANRRQPSLTASGEAHGEQIVLKGSL